MGTNFTGYFELGSLDTIRIAPIKFFAITSDNPAKEGLVAPFVEAGSTWKLDPIVLPNDSGGEETQAYNLEVTIIIPNSEHLRVEQIIKHFQNTPEDLDYITIGFSQSGEEVKGFYLPGLDYNNPLNSFPVENNEMIILPELTMTLNVEPADMRNRTKIIIKKFIPLDEEYAHILTSDRL
jgi:hypothetical protein